MVDTTSAMYGFGQVLGSLIVSVAAWGLAGGLGQVGTALRWAMVGEGGAVDRDERAGCIGDMRGGVCAV